MLLFYNSSFLCHYITSSYFKKVNDFFKLRRWKPWFFFLKQKKLFLEEYLCEVFFSLPASLFVSFHMCNLLFSLRHTQKQLKFLVSLDFFKGIMSYYAVAKGKNPGIYSTWWIFLFFFYKFVTVKVNIIIYNFSYRDECKAQVHQFSGPVFKKFKSKSEAESFIKERSGASSNYSKTAGVKKASLLATEKTYALGKNNRQTTSSSKRCLSTKSDSDEEENIIVKRKKYFQSNKSSDSKV